MLKEFMILSADIYHFRSDLLHIGPHRLGLTVSSAKWDNEDDEIDTESKTLRATDSPWTTTKTKKIAL